MKFSVMGGLGVDIIECYGNWC